MSRTEPTGAFPARFDNLFAAGPRLVTCMLRANQRSLQSLANFYVQQAENARLTANAMLTDAQPLSKSANPADFMHAWLETAEKRSGEALQRLRDSVDECREECFKAVLEAADEAAPAIEAPVEATREVTRAAREATRAAAKAA